MFLHYVDLHVPFGKRKKFKIYFVECPKVVLGKACSAECQPFDTRQRSLFAEYHRPTLGKDNGRKL
jgi:hypothetical protein